MLHVKQFRSESFFKIHYFLKKKVLIKNFEKILLKCEKKELKFSTMASETLSLKSSKNDRLLLNQTLKSTAQKALIKKFLQGNERPCDNKDFLETKDSLEKYTSDLKQMVESLITNQFSCNSDEEPEIKQNTITFDNESLTLLLILCGQNNSSQPWNTEAAVKNCEVILSQILRLLNCEDSSDLLSRNCKVNLAKNVLQALCSDLTASTWKHFPASVVCFHWIMKMIKQPELSQYLDLVLAPSLLLTDDFITENRIIGIQCLNHIIHNITIAELQLYGHGEVIYNALIPILRIREAELIEATVFPLITVTSKLEFDLGKKNPTKWSRYDSIFELYLENMELEQVIDLRNSYVKNLEILITHTGYNIVRWSKRLLRIFYEYVQTAGKYNDRTTINHCVQAIKKFIELSKEAVFLYGEHLLLILLMALYSTYNFINTSGETFKITMGCIKKLLEHLTGNEREELKKNFINNFSENLNCREFYNQIYEML